MYYAMACDQILSNHFLYRIGPNVGEMTHSFHAVVQSPFWKDVMNLASLILVLWQATVEGSGLGKSYWI